MTLTIGEPVTWDDHSFELLAIRATFLPADCDLAESLSCRTVAVVADVLVDGRQAYLAVRSPATPRWDKTSDAHAHRSPAILPHDRRPGRPVLLDLAYDPGVGEADDRLALIGGGVMLPARCCRCSPRSPADRPGVALPSTPPCGAVCRRFPPHRSRRSRSLNSPTP